MESEKRMYFWQTSFLGGTEAKNSPANAGNTRDLGLIPGWGRSPGEGHRNPLQYSCQENSVNRGAWQITAHGVAMLYTIEPLSMHARAHTHTHTHNRITFLYTWNAVNELYFNSKIKIGWPTACGILDSQPGIEPTSPALGRTIKTNIVY